MLKNNIKLFRLLGINVAIHWTWIPIVIVFSWIMQSYFYGILIKDYPDIFVHDTFVGWTLGITAVLLLFACITIHEFGHSLMAKFFKIKVLGITLFLLGGVSNLDEQGMKVNAGKAFLIAVIGPAVSFVLAILFFGAEYLLGGKETTTLSASVFLIISYLWYANLALAVFNMLPAYPLDGGRVLMSVIRLFGTSEQKAQVITSALGAVLTALMMGVGMVSAFIGWPLDPAGGAWIFIVGMFLFAINLALLAPKRRRKDTENGEPDAI